MTAQAANRIRLRGIYLPLLAMPEEALLSGIADRPNFSATSSANWNGYVSHWEVREGQLFFTELEGNVCTGGGGTDAPPPYWCGRSHWDDCKRKPISLRDICAVPHGGLHAEWFSGELRIPQGDLKQYVHAGWASSYQRELYLIVENGSVVEELIGPSVAHPFDFKAARRSLPLRQRIGAFFRAGY